MVLERVLIVDPVDGEFTGDVEVSDGIISHIRKRECTPKRILMPGFVDPHIHGVMGADTMNCDFEKMEEFLYSQGVTTFLATTVSTSLEKMKEILEKAKDYIFKNPKTSLFGVHIEGPYIAKEKKGAHSERYIRPPSKEELKKIDFPAKMLTFAPEIRGSEILLELLRRGITLSAGHSNATFEEFMKFYREGVKRITHFPNALRILHHREIGITGAGLLLDDVKVELICDGVHLSKEMVKLVYRIKGASGIILITDSISAAGLKEGTTTLGDLVVKVKEGVPRLEDGTLAGSTLFFSNAVKNFQRFTGASLKELAIVSSYNSCLELGLADRGRIKEGMKADLVLLDEDLNVVMTVKNGGTVFSA
ncbi:N-acetylglucosamine-6-phosphate deacetylase [Thermotoga sp. SG1]|uniref:N-acetylglucosamine-6-phosphate deacetylase n=1 Tax=Thermotoga sp. SG1 TaxID=126739 RepID=UPI000C77C3D5|nr:N-acetylglucosamine-6-phosphate deacetylase [Thermotoga sp. SG1]PLV56922.1 N-acetylglucosamine-6-phosphate deacetylase [Thermotoga sp. SG1]